MIKCAVSFFVLLISLSAFSKQRAQLCDRQSYLKNEILTISKANTTNEDHFAETRAQLNALIAEIKTLSNPVDEAVITQFSPGSWQQIWSDEKNMDVVGGPQRDLNQIYQYVNAAGWAYNFGVRVLPNGDQVTFALKAQASVKGHQQTTEITEAFFSPKPLAPTDSIAQISNQIQEGTSTDFEHREAGRFPKGPIGAVGILNFEYLDQDIKVGTTQNVYTGASELFVMERIEK